jgi:hypothetical protein
MRIELEGRLIFEKRHVRGKIYSSIFAKIARNYFIRVDVTRIKNNFILKPSKKGVKVMGFKNSCSVISIKKNVLENEIYQKLKEGSVRNLKVKFLIDPKDFGLKISDFSFRVRTKLPKRYYMYKDKIDLKNSIIIPATIYRWKGSENEIRYSLDLFG